MKFLRKGPEATLGRCNEHIHGAVFFLFGPKPWFAKEETAFKNKVLFLQGKSYCGMANFPTQRTNFITDLHLSTYKFRSLVALLSLYKIKTDFTEGGVKSSYRSRHILCCQPEKWRISAPVKVYVSDQYFILMNGCVSWSCRNKQTSHWRNQKFGGYYKIRESKNLTITLLSCINIELTNIS